MPLVDNGVYVAGFRTEDPKSLDKTYEAMRERKGMAWIGLYRPSEIEVRSVADEFGSTASQSTMPWPAISVQSWSDTGRHSSSSFALLGMSIVTSGLSSANSTFLSTPIS